jgi:hypothetical protein
MGSCVASSQRVGATPTSRDQLLSPFSFLAGVGDGGVAATRLAVSLFDWPGQDLARVEYMIVSQSQAAILNCCGSATFKD